MPTCTGPGKFVLVASLIISCSAIPVEEFIGYPFSSSTHRIFASNDDNAITVNIAESLLVNGTRYAAVHINNNGVLNFNTRTTAYVPQPFPINGNEYIALFWTDIDTTSCPEITNTVFYREFEVSDSDSNRAFKIINKMVESSSDFRALSGCAQVSFQTTWAFVVTWREVRYFDDVCDKYNDFQVVLATDGTLTFAIMNYARVDVGSRPPMVGVNAGDGANFRTHPDAMTADIYNISTEPGNTGELGQWVYRIDVISNSTEEAPNGQVDPRDSKIRLIPGVGTIFGGTAVRVVGPCVQDPQDIKCSYGKQLVDGFYLKDERQFLCVTPEFEDRKSGRVPFTLSFTHDGETVRLKSIFHKTIHESKVTVDSDEFPISFESVVTVRWDPELLPVKDPQNYKVDIVLYELSTTDGSQRYITTVLTDAPNSGSAEVTIPKYKTGRAVILTLFKVTLAQSHTRGKRVATLPAILAVGAVGAVGVAIMAVDNYIHQYCNDWAKSEPDGDSLLEQVDPCPKTEDRCQLQNSNFEIEGVILGFKILHRVFHPKAESCYRQRTLRTGTKAGNQCCYDKNGRLCDEPGCGGTVDKISPHVSNWDHFVEDVFPLVCGSDTYLSKRPTDTRCPDPPPPPACVYGDPHIVTLDGHKYTFNGKGEFILIETEYEEFVLQGRMIQATNNVDNRASATVFSAIVGKETNSDTVQIELDPFGGLVALVSGEEVSFDELSTLEFRNVTVSDRGNQTISATFACGAYVEVKQENAIISVMIVSLSEEFRGRTRGLMGNYNGNTSDDLIPKGSTTPISLESTLQVIHEQFGITWIIENQSESLFTYSSNQSWADYYDPSFSPVFVPTFSDPDLEEDAREICGGDTFCLFDIAATKRIDIGISTMQGNQDLERITELSLPVVCNPECGHGLCVQNDTCSCHLGYKGKLCNESDVGPCDVNICQNGGRCTRVSDTQRCDCREGYIGDRCETAMVTPNITLWRRSPIGVVVIWRVSSIHPVERFRLTVFDTTSRSTNILKQVFEADLQPRISAFHIFLVHGHRYTVQVEARVNGRYGIPGTIDVNF